MVKVVRRGKTMCLVSCKMGLSLVVPAGQDALVMLRVMVSSLSWTRMRVSGMDALILIPGPRRLTMRGVMISMRAR